MNCCRARSMQLARSGPSTPASNGVRASAPSTTRSGSSLRRWSVRTAFKVRATLPYHGRRRMGWKRRARRLWVPRVARGFTRQISQSLKPTGRSLPSTSTNSTRRCSDRWTDLSRSPRTHVFCLCKSSGTVTIPDTHCRHLTTVRWAST